MATLAFMAVGLSLSSAALQAQDKMSLDLYTTVDRLFDLEKGMTLETVVSTLQCEPHALLQHTEDGYLMLEWRYLHKDRWISAEQSEQANHRMDGDEFWVAPSSVYLMFNNNHEFVNYITEEGLGRARDAYTWQATSAAVGSIRSECKACEVSLPASFAPEAPAADEEAEEQPAGRLGGLLGGAMGGDDGDSDEAPTGLAGRLNGISSSLRGGE